MAIVAVLLWACVAPQGHLGKTFSSAADFNAMLQEKWSLPAIQSFCVAKTASSPDELNGLVFAFTNWEGRYLAGKGDDAFIVNWSAVVIRHRVEAYKIVARRNTTEWLLESFVRPGLLDERDKQLETLKDQQTSFPPPDEDPEVPKPDLKAFQRSLDQVDRVVIGNISRGRTAVMDATKLGERDAIRKLLGLFRDPTVTPSFMPAMIDSGQPVIWAYRGKTLVFQIQWQHREKFEVAQAGDQACVGSYRVTGAWHDRFTSLCNNLEEFSLTKHQ